MEELRDTIVVLGSPEERLLRLLAKLGYRLEKADEKSSFTALVERLVVDLIIIHVPSVREFRELLEHLRKDEPTKKTPVILCDVTATEARTLASARADRVEVVEAGAPVASISVKAATLLRLRKMAGAEAHNANVAETNAMLRDLTVRFRKELEEARIIQEGLLPRSLPQSDRFELAATYRPLEEVGGDWYFARTEPDGKVSLQIADVTGHGLSAAFICSMTKLALNAVNVGAQGEPPSLVLERMNSLMAPQLPDERFVTMASVLYDPATGSLQYSRAGHPPAILFQRATTEAKELKGRGFALGIMPDGKYELLSDTLAVGDVLVLYTDGITEAQNRSLELYGTGRIAEVLKKADASASATQLQEAILADFTAFSAGRILKDDVTLVVLKRTQ